MTVEKDQNNLNGKLISDYVIIQVLNWREFENAENPELVSGGIDT